MPAVDPKRLARCEELYCAGARPRDIERTIAAEFRVGKRTVRNYLKRVKVKLGAAFEGQPPAAIRARTEAMLSDAYALAKEKGDARVMADIAMRMAEVHGAHSSSVNFRGNVKVEGLADLLSDALKGDARP
jgi:hypothetical protein